MKPRSAKAKGTKLEKWVRDEFQKMGWSARRQPGSGIYLGFEHDVHLESPNGKSFIVECKARKDGFKVLDRWRGAAAILVIKPDRAEPCCYMPMSVLAEMLE